MSTISVAAAERTAEQHVAHAQHLLSAPVFGRPEAAAAAKLFIVAAGNEADFQRAGTLFSAIGQRTFYIGQKPSSANLVKLCGNFMILAAIEAMGEAMALAQKGGVPRKQLLEVLTGSLFDSPVGQSAEALRVPMPLLSVLRDHLLQTIAVEGEDLDWSGIGRSIARNAGL